MADVMEIPFERRELTTNTKECHFIQWKMRNERKDNASFLSLQDKQS